MRILKQILLSLSAALFPGSYGLWARDGLSSGQHMLVFTALLAIMLGITHIYFFSRHRRVASMSWYWMATSILVIVASRAVGILLNPGNENQVSQTVLTYSFSLMVQLMCWLLILFGEHVSRTDYLEGADS